MTTTYDFNDGNGPVPAHQHSNGGGWVADTAKVDETAYVGPDARVYDNTWVSDTARVSDTAQVYGDAQVNGSARVSGYAQVSGNDVFYDGDVTDETPTNTKENKEPKVRVEKIAHIDIEDGCYDAVIINGVKYVKET